MILRGTNVSVVDELRNAYPSEEHILARLSILRAELVLPRPTIHVISDVHGEDQKLAHVLNSGSGVLRPYVERLFGSELNAAELVTLLSFLYYPEESYQYLQERHQDSQELVRSVNRIAIQALTLLRALLSESSFARAEHAFPEPYKALFSELVYSKTETLSALQENEVLDEIALVGRQQDFLRVLAQTVNNCLCSELIVAGDLGDRGPRIDRVINRLLAQPNIKFVWGNHDASWMGAALGHLACIATVLRISLRYQRLEQLREGYHISLQPLEELADEVYAADSAPQFMPKGTDSAHTLQLARMHKAVAIMQFKLEAQLTERNPNFELHARNFLHRIDRRAGTVRYGSADLRLIDDYLPTFDEHDPYALSAAERRCLAAMREEFLKSEPLIRHMTFVQQHGSMYLVRDNHLIFHGCIPCNEAGAFLNAPVGESFARGRRLFDTLEQVVHRAFETRALIDLDMLWYLWGGPLSPLFGKDKMATFETYFLEEEETHKEHKNPYFALLHQREFCERVLREFDVPPEHGLIVNGHVPVKIDHGEDPLKHSGKAVTIDGAFSEAYGDKGYTLLIEPEGTFLAQHGHFESVTNVVREGADMLPIRRLLTASTGRTVADSKSGHAIKREIAELESLLKRG